jgi:hypothetical protein
MHPANNSLVDRIQLLAGRLFEIDFEVLEVIEAEGFVLRSKGNRFGFFVTACTLES